MKSTLTQLALIGLLLVGCEATPEKTDKPASTVPRALAPTDDTRGRELGIWSDPRFQEQFAETYIADTEIEPTVTLVEREVLTQVVQLLQEAGTSEDEAVQTAKRDEAEALLKKNYNDASSAVFDFLLGNLYFQHPQEKLEEAAAAYSTAIDKYSKFRRAWRALGMVYVRQSQWEAAIPVLTKVIDLGGGDGVTYGLLGFAYLASNNAVSAESAYRQAVLREPGEANWKMGLARSFFMQQRYADVVALTKTMLEADPNNVTLWSLQANAYLQMKQVMKAAENFELIGGLGEANAASLNLLGDIYINEELYELALDRYIQALKLDDEAKAERAVRAAQVLAARSKLDLAEDLIGQIRQLRGESLTVDEQKTLLRIESRVAVANGAGEKEAEILRQIVELDPLDGDALILLGQHAAQKTAATIGDVSQAKREAEAAAEAAEAEDATAEVKAKAEEMAAKADQAQSKQSELFAKAVFYYERAEAIEKFEADASVRHAQLLVKLGKYEQALPLLRRAQQIKHRESVQQFMEDVQRVARSG